MHSEMEDKTHTRMNHLEYNDDEGQKTKKKNNRGGALGLFEFGKNMISTPGLPKYRKNFRNGAQSKNGS
jgi:hypothetical protein